MTQKSILVARAIFPEVLEMLSKHFQVESNQADDVWSPDVLKQKMQGKVGALTSGSERIDAALLQANPQLQIVANMAVGYNNFDIAAMTAAGVLATNTPDVLTETTADRPGRRRPTRALSAGSTIFTGTRCTTLVKLPLAFSGGSRLNSAPLAGAMLSTRPVTSMPGRLAALA